MDKVEDFLGIIFSLTLIGGLGVWIIGSIFSSTEPAKCVDVTSIDYNWDNDVKCTRADGSTFYTDYSGGRKHDKDFNKR